MQSFIITIKEDTIEATGPDGIRVEPQPFTWQPTPELAPTLAQLADESSRVPPEAVKKLGAALYDALFSREIAVAFSQAQSKVGEKNLRLTLQIESPHLAALPWEALFHQADWLATDSSTPLVRRLPDTDGQSIQTLEVNRPLKVLFIGASPTGMADLNVAEQYAQLRDRLQEPLDKKIIALDGLFHPTPDQLRQTLLKDYHIIYFAGHGAPEQVETSFDGTTKTVPACIFINQTAQTKVEEGETVPAPGAPERVTAEMVAGMLRGRKNTRLVFLAACNTSTTVSAEEGQLLSGFAQQLTSRAKLPAMVAMQYYISNMQAIPLTAHFFAAIAEFVPVDVALADARNTLIRRGKVGRDVFAPVMYLQAENAALFKKAWNRAALALAAILAVVLVLAGIGGYFLEGQRAGEQARADVEATQRVYAQETAAAESTAKAIEAERADAEGERADAEATAKAIEQARADEEAEQRATAEAEEEVQRNFAFARNLAKQSDLVREEDGKIDLSVLLAIESLQHSHTLAGDQSLRTGLSLLPRLVSVLDESNGIDAVAFSPDGKWIAGGNREYIRIQDASTAKLIAQMEISSLLIDYHDRVSIMKFSTDSNLLAIASMENIQIWDVVNSQLLVTLKHEHRVTDIQFSPDNMLLTTGAYEDGTIIWDLNTDQEITRINHDNYVTMGGSSGNVATNNEGGTSNLAFSPNGQWLISVGRDNSTAIWNVNARQEVTRLKEVVGNATFSSDNEYLAIGNRIFEVPTWKEILKIEPNLNIIRFIDGERFIAMGDEQTRIFWSNGVEILSRNMTGELNYDNTLLLRNGREIWDIKEDNIISLIPHDHFPAIFSTTNARQLVVGAVSGNVSGIWKIVSPTEISDISDPLISRHMVFSSDGSWVMTESGYGKVTAWNIETRESLFSIDTGKQMRIIALSSDNKLLASGSSGSNAYGPDETIRVFEINTGQQIVELTTPNADISDGVEDVVFSANGKWLASVSGSVYAGKLQVWEVGTWKKVFEKKLMESASAVIFSPDDSLLAISSGNINSSHIEILEWPTGNQLVVIANEGGADLAFSPNSKLLASSTGTVWDAITGEEIWRAPEMGNVAFSPDGKWLALGRGIWELSSGQKKAQNMHDEQIYDLEFSSNGKWLVSISEKDVPNSSLSTGLVQFLLWRPEDLIMEACSRLIRNLTLEEWQTYLGDKPYYPTCPDLPLPEGIDAADIATPTPTSSAPDSPTTGSGDTLNLATSTPAAGGSGDVLSLPAPE